MAFTQKTLSMLEYDKVTALLAAAALTEGARAKALCLVPSGDEATVLRRQQVTADARRLIDARLSAASATCRGRLRVPDAARCCSRSSCSRLPIFCA